MFSKAEQAKSPSQISVDSTPSIISANLHIVGNLKTEGEIQVDGIIDGDVSVKALTVGANATVNGAIEADEVVVHGSVNGQINARRVELAKSAKVVGDILHESLVVEAGAYLEGHCKPRNKAEGAGKAAPEPAKDETAPDGGEDIAIARPVTTGFGRRPA